MRTTSRLIRAKLVQVFDDAWSWTYDREDEARREATAGIPPCDGRCCWDFTNGHLYDRPHPSCAALEASWRFRFWRRAHALVHNLSIRTGLNR